MFWYNLKKKLLVYSLNFITSKLRYCRLIFYSFRSRVSGTNLPYVGPSCHFILIFKISLKTIFCYFK